MDGTGSKTVYDPLGNVTYKYRLNSNQSSYDLLSQMTYDNLNRLSIQTDYLNTSQSKKDTTYTYDAEGRITDTTVKDESTIIVGEQKNSFTQAASQGASSNKYNITETTNITGQGNNNVTTAYNDELGRTKSNETSNISGGINVTYTDNNTYNNFNILTGIDGGQSSTVNSQQYQYDASGRNQEVLDGTNVHLDQTTSQINSYSQHDGINNNITATDAMGNNSNTTYDILGRGIEVDTPFETYNSITYYSKKKTYYDGSGNITEVKQTNNAVGSSEALNNDTKYTYDNMGRLIMTELIIDGTHSQFTQNYYDSQGRLRRVYTGLNKALTINGLDNVTSGGDNNYSVTKYTYDFYGRLTTYTERNRLVLS
jgi:YD repeat-containing protein